MNLKNLVIAAALLLLPVASALAAVPNLISYQGLLTDAAGTPLSNGPYLIQFRIYDAPTAGNVLWDNSFRQVQVTDGLFEYNLGDSVALPNQLFQNYSSLWLGVKVGTNPEMTPRTRLTSSGYAMHALHSDSAALAASVYDNSITSAKIADGAIAGADINSSEVQRRVTGIAAAGQAINAINADGSVTGVDVGFDGNLTGNLNLELSSATTGNILKGGTPFIHNFGTGNTFIGLSAGNLTMSGIYNTAIGDSALASNTSGAGNTASGSYALQSNTAGFINTASGSRALYSNTTGSYNTASGYGALYSNTTGSANAASGASALYNNSSGYNNTASGDSALYSNNTGFLNTASGLQALYSNTTGNVNTASGYRALYSNTTGFLNTASGLQALYSNTTGAGNTAIGSGADVSAGGLSNATAIGYTAIVNASHKIRLGNPNVTVIEGQVAYTFSSDKNQKENFQPVDGQEVLRKIGEFDLKSWNYIGHDSQKMRHYGPMAQDFFAAFGHDGVGAIGTETTINSGDMAGILMIAVQALGKENELMKAENSELKSRLDKLESWMKKTTEAKIAQK